MVTNRQEDTRVDNPLNILIHPVNKNGDISNQPTKDGKTVSSVTNTDRPSCDTGSQSDSIFKPDHIITNCHANSVISGSYRLIAMPASAGTVNMTDFKLVFVTEVEGSQLNSKTHGCVMKCSKYDSCHGDRVCKHRHGGDNTCFRDCDVISGDFKYPTRQQYRQYHTCSIPADVCRGPQHSCLDNHQQQQDHHQQQHHHHQQQHHHQQHQHNHNNTNNNTHDTNQHRDVNHIATRSNHQHHNQQQQQPQQPQQQPQQRRQPNTHPTNRPTPSRCQTFPATSFRPITAFLLVLLGLLAPPTMASYDVCSDTENDLLLPCHPSIFDAGNLANLRLTLDPSDATCGNPASPYQRLGDRANTQYTCDATSTTGNAHPMSNIIDSDRTSWWQSVSQTPGTTDLNINLTISFNKLFRFAGDVILTFNSGRPEKLVLEKSVDNGVTWSPLQFYARSCGEFADHVNVDASVTIDTPEVVICTNRYVELKSQPRPGGKVTFDLNERFELFLGPTLTDYASYYQALDEKMLDFLIFSDLRFRFIRPASDGRGNYDEYYYAIQDMNIMARCFCNLHASRCVNEGEGLVCSCQHNTQGVNCQECLPLYNERPWQRGSYVPYNDGVANECTKCECNDHADSCTYDADYGRGVCNDCVHNTRGKHCENCLEGFYPNTTTTVNDTDRCLACDCNTLGAEGENSICSQTATPPNPIGQCLCKELVTGRQCDSCVPGYYGLLEEPNLGDCTACECNLDGTEGQSNRCGQSGGQCPCKASITDRQCDVCKDQFYGFPTNKPGEGCTPCDCNPGGSISLTCDKDTGKCSCKAGIDGDKCDRSASGSHVAAIDSLNSDPSRVSANCDIASDEYTDGSPFDGTTFAQCDVTTTAASVTFDFAGGMIQAALQWPYYPTIRYTNKNPETVQGKITVSYQGNTDQPLSPLSERLGQGISPGCPTASPMERDVTLAPGTSTAIVLTDNPVVLDGRCKVQVTLTLDPISPPGRRRKRQATQNERLVQVDSVSLLPALSTLDGTTALTLITSVPEEDRPAVIERYQTCLREVSVLTSRNGAMAQAPCDQILFGVLADIYGGASACACDEVGSLFPSQCASLGGQCTCKTGVGGRACDRCHQGYFNFTSSGCQGCDCYDAGSQHGACDVTSGQCPCLSNVMTLTQQDSREARTCSECLPNFYGIDSGTGCTACSCDPQGSTDLQCDDQGQCPCKDSTQGVKCDVCKAGFYGFGADGCSACNCSQAGSTSINCDQATGTCTCKDNAQGDKCDQCKPQMFNLATYNPKGCQPCFCFGHGQGCESATGFVAQSLEVSAQSPASALDLSVLNGERHTSYGTQMSLGIEADFSLIIEDEPMVTLEGNDMKIFHPARATTTIPRETTLHYQVRLLEGEWRKDVDGTPSDVTAMEVLRILADLSKVTVLTRSQGQDLRVTYFRMQIPVDMNDPSSSVEPDTQPAPITSVEQCTCNPIANVGGLSCQDCATGYRRPPPVGEAPPPPTSFDTCVACDCNRRGATDPPECDAVTGVCLNCRNGTTGDQCGSCSDHVTGVECDTCLDEYWGLSEDGCQACACSSPGSTSTVCDKDTGQCACASNVAGRTCDKCEENFFGLTENGCQECDNCYSLLKDGVGELRGLRDSLALEVGQIEAKNSSNPSTKPFLVRFQETVDNTNKLISFLESAEASENQVQTQLDSLDQSLTTTESQLTTIDNSTLPEVETNLVTTETSIIKARHHRANLETNAKRAKDRLDVLETSSVTLSDLADDLSEAKATLQGIADASTADRQILAQLDNLNTTVHTSNSLADQVLAKAEAAREVQTNTTGELLSLETQAIVLEKKASKTTSSATSLSTQSQETSDAVAALQRNVATLNSFTVDVESLTSRSDVASAVTAQRTSQLTAGQASFQDIKTKAEATVDEVHGLTNQSDVIGNKAADWIARSRKAEEQAQIISQRAELIFQETEATLALLQDFDNKAKEVESQANAKLQQVSSVQSVSQQLIEDSQALTESLSSLQQTAVNAKEASGQSKAVIQTKLTRIEGVERLATELKTQLDSMDPGGADRLETIQGIRSTTVDPGKQLCDDVNSQVTSFNTDLANTETVTDRTLGLVGNATERASAILSELRGLEKVDANAARTLASQIDDARSGLKVEELTASINSLLKVKAEQRKDIDSLKAKKFSLQQQVESLKTLLQQIRPANPI